MLLLLCCNSAMAQNYPGGVNLGTVKGWRAEAYWGHTINNNPALFGQGTAFATGQLYGYTDYINANEFIVIRGDSFSIEYTSVLNITTPGVYQFRLSQVDNFAWLYIDGNLIAGVNCSGTGGCTSGYQSVNLTAGEHDIKVKHSEEVGGQFVTINWQGNGIPADTRLDARYVYVKNVPMTDWLNLDGAVTTLVSGVNRIQKITNKSAIGANQDMLYLPTDSNGGGYSILTDTENINFNPVTRHNGDDLYRIYNGSNAVGKQYTNGLVLRGTPYTAILSASHFQNTTNSDWLVGYGSTCSTNGLRGFYKNSAQILHGIAGNATPFASITYKTNEPYIASAWAQYTATGQTNFNIGLNTSASQGVLNNIVTTDLTTSDYGLHTNPCSGVINNFSFQEYLYYPFQLDDTQLKKVNTYMAIKWGTNFQMNWTMPNGTVVWDNEGTTTGKLNTGYQNRVFGLASHTANGNLNQKQSQSQVRTAEAAYDNTYLTLSKGSIATSNAANTGVIPDGSYLLVGDNAGALSNQSTEIPTLFTGCTFGRIGREWKARVTGSPGPISIKAGSTNTGSATFASNNTGIQIMVDQDGDGDFSTGTIRTYNYTSLVNGITTFDNVTLNDGEVFSFVYKIIAPGGIATGLQHWLKANDAAAVGNMTIWNDQSLSQVNLTASGTPSKINTILNYNPTINFDGGSYFYLASNFTLANTAGEVFSLGRTFSTNQNRGHMYTYGGSSNGQYTWSDGNIYENFGTTDRFGYNPATGAISDGKTGISSTAFNYSALDWNVHNVFSGLNNWGINVNGKNLVSTSSNTVTYTKSDQNILIGATPGYIYYGQISEVILYNRVLTASERLKVNSYYGLKYSQPISNGIGTTASNYQSSNGTQYWTGDATYKWNMFGIGRDDCSGLDQRQSKSSFYGTKTPLRLGLGTIDEINGNSGNTTGFSADYSFMMLGSNTDNSDFTAPLSAGLPTAYTSCNGKMWKTVWKVARTNFTQNIQLKVGNNTVSGFKISKAMTNPKLAVDVDGDGNFTNAVLVDYTTLISGELTFNLSASQLPDGAVFTIVWTQGVPGGVGGTAPYVWLDATDLPLNEGDIVSNWFDISGNGRDAAGLPAAGPLFKNSKENNRNYNPIVSLDGVDDYFGFSAGFNNFIAGFHNFAVSKFKNSASYARIFDFGNGPVNDNIKFSRQSTTSNLGVQVYNGGSTAGQQIVTGGITINTTNLFEFSIDAGTVGTASITKLFADSKPLALSGNVTIPNIISRANNYIGRSNWAVDAYNMADFNEFLVYNVKLSNAERLKVQSYLAVQWGFTLDQTVVAQNYLASDGSTVWDFATANQGANGNFNNDMTAIARDDCNSLNQKQSNSIDGNDIMRFGIGTIANINDTNSTNFTADKSYLFIAHNGANFSANTTNMPASMSSAAQCFQKLNRVWQVQKVGTGIGTMQFIIGKAGQILFRPTQEVRLLVGNSPTDFTAATIYQATSILGGLATFNNVSLANNQYIAVAYVNSAPGGVTSGLVRWYTAEVGTYTDNAYYYDAANDGDAVQVWTDNSQYQADVIQSTVASRPTYKKSVVNFNPSLEFDGSNDCLINDIYTGLPLGSSVRTVGTLATTYYNPAPTTYWPAVFAYGGLGGASTMFAITQRETSLDATLDRSSGTVNLTNGFAPANSSRLIYGKVFGATSSAINSNLDVAATGTLSMNTSTDSYGIGYQRYANNYFWKGSISEIFIFNRILTADEDLRIASTHAIKYGTTLKILNNPSFTTKAYLDSNDNQVYNYTSYWNRITGIARDYCSGLDQRQSMSTDVGSLVAISSDISGGMATSNMDNPVKLVPSATTASYLIFGDDNKNLGWTGERSINVNNKTLATLERTYRANETGTVGTVFVQVSDAGGTTYNSNQAFLPNHTGAVYLIVANSGTNGNFLATSGVTILPMSYIATSKTWQASYDFTAGDYFTFAAEVSCIGPAGILANLQLWLKANDGTSQTTQGAAVTTWTDASPSGNNGTGVNSPAFQATGTGVVNYNPSVSFNGTSQYFNLPTGFSDFTSGTSSFVIRKKNGTNTAWGRFLHLSTGLNNNALTFNRYIATDNIYISTYNSTGSAVFAFNSTNTPLVNTNPNILGFTLQGGTSLQSGRAFKYFYNGGINTSNTSGVVPATISRTVNRIGAGGSATEWMNGYIPEMIVYNTQLSDLQSQKVNTYLALKYGIGSLSNYVTPAYDGTTNVAIETLYDVSTFGNRIFGVGIDKTGCLVQNQSKNQEGGLMAISVDGVINTLNSADATKWTKDRNYIVIGDDNKTISSFVRAGSTGNQPLPAIYSGCLIDRVNRNWKVQVKGDTMPSLFISIPASTSTETVKLPVLPNVGVLKSYEKQKVYLVLNENSDFTINANMQEVELVYNATTLAYEASFNPNPNQLANYTLYYTIVTRVTPCREGCLKSNKHVGGSINP